MTANELETERSSGKWTACRLCGPHADCVFISGNLINSLNQKGETPQIVAVKLQRLDSIYFLLSKMADVHITDHAGRTALQLAQELSYGPAVDAISQHTAKQTQQTSARQVIKCR